MVSIRHFMGAMLEQITRARVASDAASLRVAHQYLQHDFLKGFPVPSMHVRDVELELAFAIAPGWKPAGVFQDPEVRLNAVNQLEHFVHALPTHPQLRTAFQQDARLASRWKAGVGALRERFDRALAEGHDHPALVSALAMIIHNHFYAAAAGRLELLSLVTRPFTARRAETPPPAVHQAITEGVRGIVTSLDSTSAEDGAQPESPDIGVMIGRDELEKVPENKLHRLRITVAANDRRWVSSQGDGGETVHTLTR